MRAFVRLVLACICISGLCIFYETMVNHHKQEKKRNIEKEYRQSIAYDVDSTTSTEYIVYSISTQSNSIVHTPSHITPYPFRKSKMCSFGKYTENTIKIKPYIISFHTHEHTHTHAHAADTRSQASNEMLWSYLAV